MWKVLLSQPEEAPQVCDPFFVVGMEDGVIVLFFIIIIFGLFRAAPVAYGDSQARHPGGATAAGLRHSHSNVRSKLCLQATPQLMATSDP